MSDSILQQNPLQSNIPLLTTKYTKLIAWLTGLLTLLLALFAFILSFNALTSLATEHGVSIPPLFPFVVEFAVVIFSLNALHRSLTGQSAKWQWTLIILSSLLAGTFNIAHAQNDILSRTMAAMPSLFLLLSFESFLSLVRYSVTRQSAIVTLDNIQNQIVVKMTEYDKLVSDKTTELDKMSLRYDKLNDKINDANATLKSLNDDISTTKRRNVAELTEVRQAKVSERRDKILSLLQDGMSEDDMATELNVSVRTIQRDIQSLNGKGVTK